LSQYCHGKVAPSQQKLFLLAAALNVNEAWLMGYDVPRQRTKELQQLTDFEINPYLSTAIRNGKRSWLVDDLIDAHLRISISQDEKEIVLAFREADDRTRRMILYMLGINKELTDGESKKAE
jgi:transcriptional regulator with XRE-family HTH domain